MFIKKFLDVGKVDDINASGRFIKIMNSESVLRIKATYQGVTVLETDARAGFDVQTSSPFDLIQITSQVEQKLEIWVSEHKLSYDALSTKANSSSSFLAEHFGLSGMVTPYDPAQARVKAVLVERGWWVGGEGVTDETGIYVPQGEVYSHDSASPLYAYVNDKPDLTLNASEKEVTNVKKITNVTLRKQNGRFGMFKSVSGKTFVVDMETGETLGDNLNIESSGSVEVFEDGFISVFGNKVTTYLNSDGWNQSTKSYPYEYFRIKAMVKSGDGFLCVGGSVNYTSFTETYVLFYSDGVFSERAVPAEFEGKKITQIYRDDFDGAIWVLIDGFFYRSDDELITLERVLQVGGVPNPPVFGANYIGFSSNVACKLYDRKLKKEKDLTSSFGGSLVAPIGSAVVIAKEDYLYVSEDGFDTYNEAYQHDINFITGISGALFISEDKETKKQNLFAWASNSEKAEIIKFSLTPDLTKPKAKFRVFKESF